MQEPQRPDMPKKACSIDIMFPVADDEVALDIKKKINAIVDDIKDKRFRFQIIET